ncbi:transporter substrate-binding domain-containing protein [Zooshikella marina]|uniref:substrate-binding periplasmic protein n=1 Tax=Zooshikella ganghwensis TaxID=202772 RepID=UPI001BAF3A20|nr:transporter substrate-binding domain-containing protein [Zooshikella ganghwensis]MBU2709222.1 transporter substrate-binding domain-containing protein [Zooshikella ganghwensis]
MLAIDFHATKWVVTTGFLLLLSISVSYAQNNTIVLAAEDWNPYVNQNDKDYGFICKVITHAFAKVGIHVEYHFVAWARALEMAQKGTIDGTFLWYKTPERTPYFHFSKEPLVKTSVVFFHHKDLSFDWETLEDITQYKIGAPIGSYISSKFTRYEKSGLLTVQRLPSDIIIFKMLLKNRIDIFPHDYIVGYHELSNFLSEEAINNITSHPKPLVERNTYLLISKKKHKNTELINLFNKGFSELKESGEYDQFLEAVMNKNNNNQFSIFDHVKHYILPILTTKDF